MMYGPNGHGLYCTKHDFKIFLLSICYLVHVEHDDDYDDITIVNETYSNYLCLSLTFVCFLGQHFANRTRRITKSLFKICKNCIRW